MITKRTTIIMTVAALFIIVLAVSSLSIASKRGDLAEPNYVETDYDPNSPEISQCSVAVFQTCNNESEPNDLTGTYIDPNTPDLHRYNAKMLMPFRNNNEPNIPDLPQHSAKMLLQFKSNNDPNIP